LEKIYQVKNEEYRLIGNSILIEVGVTPEHAEVVTSILLDSDQKGIHTHGFYRLQTYVEQIKKGNINPKPRIKTIKDGTNVKLMDGDDGLGYVISHYAMKEAIEISIERGIGAVGVRRSSHFGAAAYYAEMAAKKNQIGIVMTNASPGIAPTGSIKPVLGNNPWSISTPTNLDYPITLDIANSVSARGKIRLKALTGEPIPLGWALNKEGKPTINAQEALNGVILPIGDYKGYGITLMIDILSGVLTGSQFGDQVPLIDGNRKRNNGHLFISLNVEAFMELSHFKNRVDELVHMIKSAPKIQEDVDILLPGEREWKTKLSQDVDTVRLPESVCTLLESLTNEYRLQMPEFKLVQ
jgi:LDH2 family malate/lactate/ureidoglycolate dehydrogenase